MIPTRQAITPAGVQSVFDGRVYGVAFGGPAVRFATMRRLVGRWSVFRIMDSTFYSNPGMLKTIELILGLPTMSLFDLIAADMRASFTEKPDFTPFNAIEPVHDLFEVNPPLKALHGAARRDAESSLKIFAPMALDLDDHGR